MRWAASFAKLINVEPDLGSPAEECRALYDFLGETFRGSGPHGGFLPR